MHCSSIAAQPEKHQCTRQCKQWGLVDDVAHTMMLPLTNLREEKCPPWLQIVHHPNKAL